MCKLFQPINNSVKKTVLPYTELLPKLKKLSGYSDRRDDWYFCADISDVMNWCYQCRGGLPAYESNTQTEQGFDCDKFAACFMAYCFSKKLTNAIWEARGDTPQGAHAWNFVGCPDGIYEIEPQTGDVWVLGSNPEYVAKSVR